MIKQASRNDSLDFDFWMQLAKDDPKAFESTRQEKIEELINRAPRELRRRLRGLQWQVDQARHLAGSPMASCLAISDMMWDSLHQLQQHQSGLSRLQQGQPLPAVPPASSATVLNFPG